MKIYLVSILNFLLCLTLSLSSTVFPEEKDKNRVVRYLKTIGQRGEGKGQFKEPSGITISPDGFLYIADTGNNRIEKLSWRGEFICEVGGFGWDKQQFDGPVAISARNGLDVLVADYYNERIERYDKDLNYLSTFSSSDDWPDDSQFGFPKDVDISAQGELFCLDGENNRILKLDVMGIPQRSFGDYNSGEGRLILPQRLVVTSTDRVFVSDEELGSIVMYDIHGNYIHTLGLDIFEMPMDMTLVGNELLLVADAAKRDIIVLHISGALITTIREDLENPDIFIEPVDVCYWDGKIFVLDRKGCSIHIFQWLFSEENLDW